jgi:hypothetical protein
MKNLAIAAAFAASFACAASAQTVETIIAAKGKWFVQSGAGSVAPSTLGPGTNAPFEYWCTVGGIGMETLSPAPSVTGPFASIINNGVMGLNPWTQEEWQYGPPDFATFANTLAALNAAYPNGTYTVTVQGVQVPLALTGNLYPSSAPVMTVSGGTWAADGHYEIYPDAALSVTTSAFGAYGSHVLDVIGLEVYGTDTFFEQYNFSTDNPVNFATISLPPGTLLPGDYNIDAGFIACSQASSVPGLPDALAVAFYESGTRIRLRVLPPANDTELYWFTVGKGKWHRQLAAATVVPGGSAGGALPFEFWANAGGIQMTSAPRVTGPISNPEPSNNNGFLGLSPFGFWRYGAPSFDDYTVGSLAQLDQLFGNGTYTFTGAGQVKSVGLLGDIYPTQAPRMAVQGGTWIAPGVCLVEPTGFTVTTSGHPEWDTAVGVDQEIMLTVYGDTLGLQEFSAASENPGNPTLSIGVPGALLTPGSKYGVLAKFHNLSDSIGLPSVWYAIASYATATEFTIQVRVPADLDADGQVNGADLGILLGEWGACSGCGADLDGNGTVDGADLGIMLGEWG